MMADEGLACKNLTTLCSEISEPLDSTVHAELTLFYLWHLCCKLQDTENQSKEKY